MKLISLLAQALLIIDLRRLFFLAGLGYFRVEWRKRLISDHPREK